MVAAKCVTEWFSVLVVFFLFFFFALQIENKDKEAVIIYLQRKRFGNFGGYPMVLWGKGRGSLVVNILV